MNILIRCFVTILLLFNAFLLVGCGKSTPSNNEIILEKYSITLNVTSSSISSTGNASVQLTWNPLPTANITGYNIYRKIESINGIAIRTNPQIITRNLFTDSFISIQNKITTINYHGTFLDLSLNESAASEIVTIILTTPTENNTPKTPSENNTPSLNIIETLPAPSSSETQPLIRNYYTRTSAGASFQLESTSNISYNVTKNIDNSYTVSVIEQNNPNQPT